MLADFRIQTGVEKWTTLSYYLNKLWEFSSSKDSEYAWEYLYLTTLCEEGGFSTAKPWWVRTEKREERASLAGSCSMFYEKSVNSVIKMQIKFKEASI